MISPENNELPPLAVVGMSFQFPGDAVSAETFWQLIMEGRPTTKEFPPDRLTIDAFYHPDSDRVDRLSLKGGNFLEQDLSRFDEDFFSINPTEAKAMDPQQRLLLETAYHCFENAGIPTDSVSGSKTCVFVGSFSRDYELLHMKDNMTLPKFEASGTNMNMFSNRVSWFFNLVGPSATIDTACSSSLAAVDLACQSIWNGESSMGLAMGSNLMVAPEQTLSLNNLGLLSPDSRCYSFDERGNGYVRGEGVGGLVIRPLDEAIRAGDPIRAVIRSSSSNQDGRTPGILQPSGEMQERLILDTYKKANLDLATTRYVEAHGTGTPVGDPIEVNAIGTVFQPYRSNEDPLYIGSVKSTVGHLEGASGLAGMVKTILALEKGVIPPNTDFKSLNPSIDEQALNIKIPGAVVPWPANGVRRASVSSFGFGGSNSHIILDDAVGHLRTRSPQCKCDRIRKCSLTSNGTPVYRLPSPDSGYATNEESNGVINGNHVPDGSNGKTNGIVNGYHADAPIGTNGIQNEDHNSSANGVLEESDVTRLLVWSASDEDGLSRIKDTYGKFFNKLRVSSKQKTAYLSDMAYTLGKRRTSHPWRAFAVVRSSDDWTAIKDGLISATSPAKSINPGLVFSGQGAQWHAMGRELLDNYPVFRDSLEKANDYLRSLGNEWDVLEELLKDKYNKNINRTDHSQTLCTALQLALVDLLRYFGVKPKTVVGHSSGEIAAAYSAGAISRDSAWKIAFYRGKFSSELENSPQEKGSMLAVALPENEMKEIIDGNLEDKFSKLSIACVNSPKSVTISGEVSQLDALKAHLDASQVFSRRLKVGVAYHSSQMREIASKYEDAIGTLKSGIREVDSPQMVSSVTGTWIRSDVVQSAAYWRQNLVSQVRFSDAISTTASGVEGSPLATLNGVTSAPPINHLLEVGPHSALQGPIKDILASIDKHAVAYDSMIVRDTSAIDSAMVAMGHLFLAGCSIDILRMNMIDCQEKQRSRQVLTDLPAYPFNHSKSHWHEGRISRNFRMPKYPRKDLLGLPDLNWNPYEPQWRNIMRLSEMSWIRDHQINGSVLFPGAGMLAMAVEAARQLGTGSREISKINIKDTKYHSAMQFPKDSEALETSFTMIPLYHLESKGSKSYRFNLYSLKDESWTANCTGSVQIVYKPERSDPVDGERLQREFLTNQLSEYSRAKSSFTTEAERSAIYKHLAECHFGFGESFQLMDKIYGRPEEDQEAIGEVRRGQLGDDLIIQPNTLDAITQPAVWLLTKFGAEVIPTTVGKYVQSLSISPDSFTRNSTDPLRVHAKAEIQQSSDKSSSLTVFDSQLNEVLLNVGGVTTLPIEGSKPAMQQSAGDNLCHLIEWKPDLKLLDKAKLHDLCKPEQQPNIQNQEREHVNQCMDFMLLARLMEALRGLSEEFIPSKPHLQKYIQWAEAQKKLFQSGKHPLRHSTTECQLKDMRLVESTEAEVFQWSKGGQFLTNLSKNLMNVLTEQMDPLQHIMDGPLVAAYYDELMLGSNCHKYLTEYLDLASHANPMMNILEIGAGTGSATSVFLQTIGSGWNDGTGCRYAHWDFTDISRSFFEAAAKRFEKEADRMDFKKLNIEEDPGKQGFQCGSYDMVLACLVFHATSNLTRTLTHARSLLKPGGKLIMLEMTNPARSAVAFGLLEGWWLGSEPYRSSSPCVDETRWNDLLCQTGFTGCDLVCADHDRPASHETSLIISTAIEGHQAALEENLAIDIVLNPSDDSQRLLASMIAHNSRELTENVRLVSLEEACESSGQATRIVLLEYGTPALFQMDETMFDNVKTIFTSPSRMFWIRRCSKHDDEMPKKHLIDGLLRVLDEEDGRMNRHILSLEDPETEAASDTTSIMSVIHHVLSSAAQEIDAEYHLEEGIWKIGRVVDYQKLNDAVSHQISGRDERTRPFGCGISLTLDSRSSNTLDSLRFVEDERLREPLRPHEVECEVKCTGINFRDLLVCLGQLDATDVGLECAGVVTKVGSACRNFSPGDRVVAFAPRCFSSHVRFTDTDPAVKIPDGLDFAAASAIPVNFMTAYVALSHIARLQAGETVLIHSGAGGTGQAAIQIAKYLGAEVFTTVGSVEKMEFLQRTYDIPERNIFSSRSVTFSMAVKQRTRGKGVDVVLNSLSGQGLMESWECIAAYGRFVEIGKKDILSNTGLPMHVFLKNASFSGLDLAAMTVDRPGVSVGAMEAVLNLIAAGKLHPPEPLSVYGVGQLEEAFRLMQTGKHLGKIVIEMRKGDEVMTVLETKPNSSFDPSSTYVVAGGLRGLGRRVVEWMVSRGARNMLLLSRSGDASSDAQKFIHNLHRQGVTVMAPACDISDQQALQNTIKHCTSHLPPIKGCIQTAMVLEDMPFDKMTHSAWKTSMNSKVLGSWNLHVLLPKDLDFFIMFSSLSGIAGTRGQSNYAAGNTFQDALAAHRISNNQNASSLDLGRFVFAGAVASSAEMQQKAEANLPVVPVTESEFLAILDCYCNPDNSPKLSSQPLIKVNPPPEGRDRAYWLEKPMLSHLRVQDTSASSKSTSSQSRVGGGINLVTAFRDAKSETTAVDATTQALTAKLAKVLSLSEDELTRDGNRGSKPIQQYGVDSLVAMELRSWFAKEVLADIAVFDVLGHATISSTAEVAVRKSRLGKGWVG